jgi:SP family general alpha glucoside:H+ symporter-like MFS transporter
LFDDHEAIVYFSIMAQNIHIEHTFAEEKTANLSEKPVDIQKEYLSDPQTGTNEEHNLTLLKANGWSILLSTAIVMEGYGTKLIGFFLALPAFQKKYGQKLPNGKYEIPAPWQAGLINSATVGGII